MQTENENKNKTAGELLIEKWNSQSNQVQQKKFKDFNIDEEVLVRHVRLFDGTDGLDLNEDIKQILNDKLQKIIYECNAKLQNLHKLNQD